MLFKTDKKLGETTQDFFLYHGKYTKQVKIQQRIHPLALSLIKDPASFIVRIREKNRKC